MVATVLRESSANAPPARIGGVRHISTILPQILARHEAAGSAQRASAEGGTPAGRRAPRAAVTLADREEGDGRRANRGSATAARVA